MINFNDDFNLVNLNEVADYLGNAFNLMVSGSIMSLLYKSYLYVSVECDMNYDKYDDGGRRYVPCIFKLTRPIARKVSLTLGDYTNRLLGEGNKIVNVRVINDAELDVRIYADAMKKGYTTGELVDRLMGVVEGYMYCA